MTSACSSTANSITEILFAGDAVLNLTQQPLNAVAGTLFLKLAGDQLVCQAVPTSIVWDHSLLFQLRRMVSGQITRLVIVAEENCSDAEFIARELGAAQVSHICCTLMSSCDVDDFMDEQDAEAVTERLRQLGYI